ncbi:Arginase family enzyme [Polaribacter sp. Hel1_33_78]|jgi:formiminoglutamase|uniref:formimidoylglutamase n=1 Tax=unclassified Polaribacter TaxID=196858 RepID=UPI00087A2861|nr:MULTISPECIES: formimidoylglutamase [unclassified Polaribacter]MBT4412744.1 formimidoylglutamase [Polaribacter sp.]MDG1196059.1 formimidoylglutamase [Polaribacter sp.]MDG1403528.1 formimidoylglutamase [Polaribacter sp.]SDU22507.1 Arginase family enzyme [Polaribacter sp. Hel1_33_78]
MNQHFLSPVKEAVLAHLVTQSFSCLGKKIRIHSKQEGFPDLKNVQLAIFGVEEDRNSENNFGCGEDLQFIRNKLYQLFPGNWQTEIADLGNVPKGNSVTDTYFAVSELITYLLKKNIIPIIIGGGQDITYVNYRAYDSLEQTVNITAVDSRFDLGNLEDDLTSQSYLSKVIMQEPSNLFNYSNVGYQTYFNAQEEIELLDNLFFDSYRLGKAKELENIEPAFRNADIVSIDIGAIRQSEAPANNNASPNGFYGEEICAISRYAGISDKVTSFGIYEYNSKYDNNHQTANLIAQMIWYFIEGVNFRVKDYPFSGKENYQKFTVLMENDDPLIFYKSNKTGRWWIEINILSDNKYKRHALIPCTFKDYTEATKQIIPERWYKAMRKML